MRLELEPRLKSPSAQSKELASIGDGVEVLLQDDWW